MCDCYGICSIAVVWDRNPWFSRQHAADSSRYHHHMGRSSQYDHCDEYSYVHCGVLLAAKEEMWYGSRYCTISDGNRLSPFANPENVRLHLSGLGITNSRPSIFTSILLKNIRIRSSVWNLTGSCKLSFQFHAMADLFCDSALVCLTGGYAYINPSEWKTSLEWATGIISLVTKKVARFRHPSLSD